MIITATITTFTSYTLNDRMTTLDLNQYGIASIIIRS